MKKFASKTSRLELMQLPDDEFNTFPVSVIRRYAESTKPLSPNVNTHGDKLMIDEYHNHPLILTHQVSSTTTKACNLACDLCTRPIPISIPIPIPSPTELSSTNTTIVILSFTKSVGISFR